MFRWRQLVAVVLLAVAALVGAGGSANADGIWDHFWDLPGTSGSVSDCLKPPVATSPNDGLAGWIDPGPDTVVTGDPFAAPPPTSSVLTISGQAPGKFAPPTPPRPTIYDVYGYGGLRVVAFDDGCLTVNTWNAIGNFLASVSAALVAATVWLYRLVVGSALSGVLTPVQAVLTNAWGYGLFLPLLGLGLGVTGIYFLVRARRGQVGQAAGESATTGVIVMVGLACMMYSVTIGPAVATGITGAAQSVNEILTNRVSRTPADSIASTVHEAALWNTWEQGTFGNGVLNQKVANEFAPRLFAASTNSRAEQATIDADPSKAKALSDAKQADYKTVAKEIQDKYPQVYEFVAGNRSGDQIMFDLAGFVAVVAACAFLLWASFKVAYALIVVFLGIGVAPALALFSQFPRLHHVAFAALGVVRDGVVKGLLFSVGAIVFVVACIQGILNPDLAWHPLLKSGALLLITVGAWVGARKLGVASDLSKMRQVGKRLGSSGGGKDTPERKAPARETRADGRTPVPTGAAPAEASMKTRAAKGAAGGAVKVAAVTVATGGTATAGAVAAAGAKGAARGVVAGGVSKGRHRAPSAPSAPVHRTADPAVYNSTDRSTILDPMQGGMRQRRVHHIHTPEKVPA